MTKAKLYFTTGDPQELDNLESSTLIISGISTLGTVQISSGIISAYWYCNLLW